MKILLWFWGMMALMVIPFIMIIAEPQGWWTFVGMGVLFIYISIGVVKFDKATRKEIG